jgi:hypothetical protein
MMNAVQGRTLCTDLQNSANTGNISSLKTPSATAKITALCYQNLTFDTIFGNVYPSSQPTTSSPSKMTKFTTKGKILATAVVQPIDIVSNTDQHTFIGGIFGFSVLCILGFWGYLRCLFFCFDLVAMKKERGHLYDILVIVNDSEELILQNVRHKDIAYFRDFKVQDSDLTWELNNANDVIAKRFEVEFFDRFDLIGRGRDTNYDKEGTCNVDFGKWRETYTDQSVLETGMIIRVHFDKGYKKYKEDDCMDDSASTVSRIKVKNLWTIMNKGNGEFYIAALRSPSLIPEKMMMPKSLITKLVLTSEKTNPLLSIGNHPPFKKTVSPVIDRSFIDEEESDYGDEEDDISLNLIYNFGGHIEEPDDDYDDTELRLVFYFVRSLYTTLFLNSIFFKEELHHM